jgi:phosphoribosylaminoimidazolecarboxamide formyltransferase / IMP cyclohydrolase
MKRALISVSDKTGIVEFARSLNKLGYEIVSTGGTLKYLEENGVSVIGVDAVTGFPEIMDGRVKTLHPKIHGGILAVRDNPDHMDQLKQNGIVPIDIVVVNLYPFSHVIQKHDVTLEEAIENIDIGGPTMIRSAAKNYRDVAVITSPDDYTPILSEITTDGQISQETKRNMALKVFKLMSEYNQTIFDYLSAH